MIGLLTGYVGSKVSMAERVKLCFEPSCTHYAELFCGSAAVYMSLSQDEYEKYILNEANPEIYNLYNVMKNNCDEFIEILDSIDFTKKNWVNNFGKRNLGETTIEKAVDTYLKYNFSFNCSGKNFSSKKLNMADKYYGQIRRKLIDCRYMFSPNVTILNKDAVEIVLNFDDPKYQLFLDPPYVGIYRRSKKLYDHEMNGLVEHYRLAQLIKDSKAAIVLSGYRPHDNIPAIYDVVLGDNPNWRCFCIEDRRINSCDVVSIGTARRIAQEFIWTNREPKEHAECYISLENHLKHVSMDEYFEIIRKVSLRDDERKEYAALYKYIYNKRLWG